MDTHKNNYYEDLFSLRNKVVLISGASTGIGLELASNFSEAGANVFGFARTEKIKDVNFSYHSVDIRDKSKFENLCSIIHEKFKKIDVLINCAGISISPYNKKKDDQYFDKIIKTNLSSVYDCCMIMAKYTDSCASIINISSIASNLGFPNNPAYVASKGGVSALTRALAYDFSDLNIRVNNIVPGYIHTSMTDDSYKNDVLRNERKNNMIIKRWGNVKDIIGGAVFLASDASSYITGSDLVIDGGWSIKGL